MIHRYTYVRARHVRNPIEKRGESRRRPGWRSIPQGERVEARREELWLNARGPDRKVGDQPQGERVEARREELWLNARGLDRKLMIVLD